MSRRILILSGDTFEIRTLCMALEVEKLDLVRCTKLDQLWTATGEGAPPAALIADMTRASWDDLRSIFRRFRVSERGRHAPVLVLGDPGTIADQETVEASGVNPTDFFPPPVDAVALVRRIQAIPDEGEEPPEGFKVGTNTIRGAVVGPGGGPEQAAPGAAGQGAFPDHGPLQKITPARLLTTLSREGASGRLELDLPDGRTDVFFEGGKLVHLRTRGEFALGRLVVAEGLTTLDRVELAGDPSTVTLDSMMALGFIGPHQAFDLLKTQLVRWLKGTASQRNGTYRWRQREIPPDGAFPLDVPLYRTLLDGLVADPPVSHPLPPKLAQAVPMLTPQGKELLAELNLNAVESRLVRELDGHGRLWNIVHQLGAGDDARMAHLEALIIGLRDIGAVSLKVAKVTAQTYTRPDLPRRPPGEERPAAPPRDEQVVRLKKEIERLKDADPFETLGVHQDATMEEVRKVFFELSKQYHPDKFFEASPEVREGVEEIFKHIQDAYGVLSDPEQREAFRKMRLAGIDRPITEDDERKATIYARQGQLYLKNRNYDAARTHFELAAELNPLDKDHLVYATWTAHLASPKDVVRHLQKMHAVLMSPHNSPEGFHFFGVMLKASGDQDQARKAFQKAMSLRPGYLEPERELRLMDLRKRKADEAEEKTKKTGFFGLKRS